MKPANKLPFRRSIRLANYDYSQNDAYFITICSYQQKCIFGEIVNDDMQLNDYGKAVQQEWLRTEMLRPSIELDAFVVMPNHFHGIFLIHNDIAGSRHSAIRERFGKPVTGSVPTIVRAFKSAVTRRVNERLGMQNVSIWQRNYYEHIIRNEGSLSKLREYIDNNPINWALDKMNPSFLGDKSN